MPVETTAVAGRVVGHVAVRDLDLAPGRIEGAANIVPVVVCQHAANDGPGARIIKIQRAAAGVRQVGGEPAIVHVHDAPAIVVDGAALLVGGVVRETATVEYRGRLGRVVNGAAQIVSAVAGERTTREL